MFISARRPRHKRLVAALAATYHPRRMFPLGTEQGGVYYPDDPNALLRRRNLLTYTTGSYVSPWTVDNSGATNPTVTTNYAKAPDGTMTAARVQLNKTGGVFSRLRWVGAWPVGNPYVVSIYACTTSGLGTANVGLRSADAGGTNMAVTGAWQRFSYSLGTITAPADFQLLLWDSIAGNDETADILIWGAQLERDTTASPYQPVTDWNTEYMAAVGHLVTQFTDSAGTTPVTKVTDPVGLTLDRRFGLYRGPQLLTSGAIGLTGSATAATYSTTTGAGTVTRVDASNQSWVQFSGLTAGRSYQITVSGVSGGTLQVRDGSATGTVIASTTSGTPCLVTATGTTITLTASAAATVAFTVTQIQWLPGNHRIQATSGSRKTLSARVNLLLASATMSTQNVTTVATSYKLSFTGTGTVTLSGTSTAGPLVGTGASDRVSLTFTPTAGTLTLTVSGSVTLADLRTADDAAKAIPAYQRVNTASDYDTDGYPFFWLYDGTDDSDATASTVDGSASDKVTVIVGVTKNSDAAVGMFLEHTTSVGALNGGFYIAAPAVAASTHYGFATRGTSQPTVRYANNYAAPASAVLSAAYNNATGTAAQQAPLWVNGVTPSSISDALSPTTAANYVNATEYWGRRAGSTLPFNGREYATILRFGPMSDGERNQAERWVAQRMGVTI
mgnify:CR=1 FL=1